MTDASVILERAGHAVGDYLPRLLGALALLIIGLIVARLLARLLRRVLTKAGLDRLAERSGIHDVLARAGLERSFTRLLVSVLWLAASLVVVVAVVAQLGIDSLDNAVDSVILFLPKLLAAAGIMLAGLVLASLARERVDRAAYQMDLPGPLGQAVQISILIVFGVIALSQIDVSTTVLNLIVAIAVAGFVLTLALAFGLGGREMAVEISAGRYLAGLYEVGQTVGVDGVEGAIVALEPGSVLLETEQGRRVRVPNSSFVRAAVSVSSRA